MVICWLIHWSFITTFDSGKYQFKPAIGLDMIGRMCGNYDPFTGMQQNHLFVYHKFCLAFDHLHEGFERARFFLQPFAMIKGNHTDITR